MKNTETIYVLFGEDLCRIVDSGEEVTEDDINCHAYDLKAFDESSSVVEVLSAASGWNDYSILSEEEYNKIKNL